MFLILALLLVSSQAAILPQGPRYFEHSLNANEHPPTKSYAEVAPAIARRDEETAVPTTASVTAKLSGTGLQWGFTIPVDIAGQTFRLTLDTGSYPMWVFSTLLPADQVREEHTLYSIEYPDCPVEKREIEYGDNSGVLAVNVDDDVSIDDITVPAFRFGAAELLTPDGKKFASRDGVFGLGPGAGNWLDEAFKAKKIVAPHMTIDLPASGDGRVDIGFTDETKIKGTVQDLTPLQQMWAVTTASLGACLLDTGSPFILIDSDALESYYRKIDSTKWVYRRDWYLVKCDLEMPDWGVKIAGDTWTTPGSSLKSPPTTSSQWCHSRLQPAARFNELGCTLGLPFLSSFILIIDGTDGDWEMGIAHRA